MPLHAHDGYSPHSHEARAGHLDVSPDPARTVITSSGGVGLARDDAATALADRTSPFVFLRSGDCAIRVHADLSVTTTDTAVPAAGVPHYAALLAVATEITAYARSIRDGDRHPWQ